MLTYPPDLDDVLEAMRRLGHVVFEGSSHPYDLNLIGIRAADRIAETFNDWICAAYVVGDRWVWLPLPATTDPGLYWRQNPMNVKGTAIFVPGQHRGAFKAGLHRGKPALIQAKPLPVFRDADRDAMLDFDGPIDVGWHGLNLHPASARISETVGRWSAGCQVVQDDAHFDLVLALAVDAFRHHPTLTYTLLTEEQLTSA